MVFDANVWISRAFPEEVHHTISRRWVRGQLASGTAFAVPNLLLAEVGGGIARRTGDPRQGREAVRMLLSLPRLSVVPLDASLGDRAAELAALLRLRGHDATYVAVAEARGVPLVTWDREILTRASAVVATLQPS